MSIFIKDSDYEIFVGKNFDYYAIKWHNILHNKCQDDFEKFKSGKKVMSFNLSAFFFGYFWSFYRKMYWRGLALLIIAAIYPIVTVTFACIMSALFQDWFYFSFVQKKIDRIRLQTKDEDIIKTQLKQKGGTSKLSLVIGIILSIFVAISVIAINDSSSTNSSSSNDYSVPYWVKSTIEDMRITSIFNPAGTSVMDIASKLAGANGRIEWKNDNKNNYYINIVHSKARTDYMKFSHNTNTDYILLTEIKVNGRTCKGVNQALECLAFDD